MNPTYHLIAGAALFVLLGLVAFGLHLVAKSTGRAPTSATSTPAPGTGEVVVIPSAHGLSSDRRFR